MLLKRLRSKRECSGTHGTISSSALAAEVSPREADSLLGSLFFALRCAVPLFATAPPERASAILRSHASEEMGLKPAKRRLVLYTWRSDLQWALCRAALAKFSPQAAHENSAAVEGSVEDCVT